MKNSFRETTGHRANDIMGIKSGTEFCFLLFVFCLPVLLTNADEDYPQFSNQVANTENGKTQLTQMQDWSQNPRYGQCWTGALARLQEGCKQLTEDEQGRMALSFANCHLEKAGFETYQCTDDQPLTSCLEGMKGDVIAFNAYTEFFTHTQDVCFFLQSQVWHERTENTVSRLAKSSENVVEQLDTSSKLQEEMIEKQSSSLEHQEEILKNEAYLKEALKESTRDMQGVFAEMKENTENQRAQIDATFDRVNQIQRVILGEFSWMNSIIFYGVAILISYLVTSTPRTCGARLVMFAVLAVDWCVERMIFSASADKADQELLYHRMWVCRQLFCTIAALVLFICAYRYKDLAQLNYQLLLDIKRQNSELRHKLDHPSALMSALKSSSQPMLAMGAPTQALRHHQRLALDAIDSPEPLALGAYSSDEGITSDSEDRSYLPEITYHPDQDDTESIDSFMTADPASRRPSRVATPTHMNDTSMQNSTLSETVLGRNGLFNASMLNGSIAFMAPSSSADSSGSSTSTAKRKRGRPKGSKNRSSRDSTPMDRSFGSPYNLRTRRGVLSPNMEEDVRTFIRQVEAFQDRNLMVHRVEPVRSGSPATRTMRRKPLGTPSTNTSGFFSSDEEM